MVLQIPPGKGIKRRERLVQQQHFRLRHQRTRDRDPLRLPAGQFTRPRTGLVGETDPRQRACDLLAAKRGRQFRQPEADIVGDAEPGKQTGFLKDDADLGMRRRDDFIVERHCA